MLQHSSKKASRLVEWAEGLGVSAELTSPAEGIENRENPYLGVTGALEHKLRLATNRPRMRGVDDTCPLDDQVAGWQNIPKRMKNGIPTTLELMPDLPDKLISKDKGPIQMIEWREWAGIPKWWMTREDWWDEAIGMFGLMRTTKSGRIEREVATWVRKAREMILRASQVFPSM